MRLSGQIEITTSGTAVRGDITRNVHNVAIKAHPDNAGPVWVGDDGSDDVDDATGFPLSPGEGVVLTGSLSQYWFDADNDGDRVCWLILAR